MFFGVKSNEGTIPFGLPTIQYSRDKETWNTLSWIDGVETEKLSIAPGESIYFKGNNPQGFSYRDGSYTRREVALGNSASTTESLFNLSGNIMSLLGPYVKTIPCVGCFSYFCATTSNIDGSVYIKVYPKGIILPAKNVLLNTYYRLFHGYTIDNGEVTCLAETGIDSTNFKQFLRPASGASTGILKVAKGTKSTWESVVTWLSQWTIEEI